MAQFFKAQSSKKAVQKQFNCRIHDLDLKGQGVGKMQERVIFVPGALPGETILARAAIGKKGPIQAELQQVKLASPARVEPACRHYQVCGGCQLQHLQSEQQIIAKQAALKTLLTRKGLEVAQWAEPLCSPEPWRYRTKVRLAIDARKQVKVGFRHADSNKILNLSECPVMAAPLEALLLPLQQLIQQLQDKTQIGHAELLLEQGQAGLWLHKEQAWSEQDWALISQWLEQHQVKWLDDKSLLDYELSEFKVKLSYKRSDFIQSNLAVNEAMVAQAIAWLELQGDETVLDLFCGMGNFSLPLARKCAQVTGVEGVQAMVNRAQANAQLNQIDNVRFYQADLSERLDLQTWWQPVDVVLLDPARAGAEKVASELAYTQAKKVLYVSCNPTTLVRDAQLLVRQGYKVAKAGVMDMFPQTHHLESMILFSKIER